MSVWCAAPAYAQRTSSLSWVRLRGAEACIPTQTLAERVEQRVGRQVFVSASQADLSLEGHVERAADGSAFVATLVVSDREGRVLGKRVLRAPGDDCSALDPALVLVIAIGLDPDAALPATRDASNQLSGDTQALLSQLQLPKLDENALRDLAVPDPEAVRAQEARAREAAARAQAERAARARARKPSATATGRNASPLVRVDLALGVDGELGVLPGPALGASLRVALVAGALWPIELSLTGLLPQSKTGVRTSGRGELTFAAAGLGLCTPGSPAKSFELFACLGARAGILRAAGLDFAENTSVTSAWVEPALLAGVRLRPGRQRWSLELRAGPGVPLIRDTYRYQGEMGVRRQLHRPAPIIGRLELAGGVSF